MKQNSKGFLTIVLIVDTYVLISILYIVISKKNYDFDVCTCFYLPKFYLGLRKIFYLLIKTDQLFSRYFYARCSAMLKLVMTLILMTIIIKI